MTFVSLRSGWFSQIIAGISVFGALSLALGSTAPATLLTTIGVGASAIVVALALPRQTATAEFVTSIAIPVLGLLVVLTPAIAIVELYGLTVTGEQIVTGATLGVTAATAGAIGFPLALGAFRADLSKKVYGTSGQLLVPLSAAVLLVFLLDQLRIFSLVPPPLELYAFLTVEPAESSDIAALLVTSTLVAAAIGYLGFVLSRPLSYEFVYPEERDGRVLQAAVWLTYRLALGILGVCWLSAGFLLFESNPQVSYPAGFWLLIDSTTTFATNLSVSRLAVNMLLVSMAVTVLASPLYAIRWVERTGTLWLIRLVFSGALAMSVGLVAAYLTQQALVQSASTITTLDATPGGWAAFEWLPVIFTAVPLVGTAILFGSSMFYTWFFERGSDAYSQFITYRNVGLGALLFSLVVMQAVGGSLFVTLAGATLAVIAWDSFEYAYTLHAELPGWYGSSVPELLHTGLLVFVLSAGVGFTLVVDRWLSPVVSTTDGALVAVILLVIGLIGLLFAIRE